MSEGSEQKYAGSSKSFVEDNKYEKIVLETATRIDGRVQFDKEFNPEKLVEFVRGKMSEGSNLVVGQEYLINLRKDLVKVTKITPTLVTFKHDVKEEDRTYQDGNYLRTEGHFARTFKGKTQSVKKKSLTDKNFPPEPVPTNFNYKWRSSSDMG
jgi:hypothetical protein